MAKGHPCPLQKWLHAGISNKYVLLFFGLKENDSVFFREGGDVSELILKEGVKETPGFCSQARSLHCFHVEKLRVEVESYSV